MAADRSHLVPTLTTDVNGKRTTVYRRAQPNVRKAVPAPTLPSPASKAAAPAQATGEFPEPKERTVAELKSALRDMQIYSDGPSVGRGAKVLRAPKGRYATRLALDLIEDGALSREDALLVLSYTYPEQDTAIAADALRVAAAIKARVDPAKMPWNWHERIAQSVRGAIRGFSLHPSAIGAKHEGARTQAQITQLAAIAEFTLNLPRQSPLVFAWGQTGPEQTRAIAYPALEAIVREQPEAIHRILDYVNRFEANWHEPEAVQGKGCELISRGLQRR